MSFFGDALGFEAFHAGDLWDRIKKDPKRLVLGVDPLSTKAWNAVLGRKDEPLVDQLGGAYGGHVISAFGNNDGGVYKRAREAGIDTGAGESMQNAAHVIAAIYGGNGLFGAAGGNAGSGITGPMQTAKGLLGTGGPTGTDLGVFSNGGQAGMSGVGGGNAGLLASQGGISGGAGMGSATAPASMGMQDYLKMAQGMGGNGGQQQPQAAQPAPTSRHDNTALLAQIKREARAQFLRKKINRTPQENQELRALTQSAQQGLVG